MADQHPTRSTEAFFGRRRGKAMKPRQAGLYAEQLPVWKIDIDQPTLSDLTSLFDFAPDALHLEIGFGGGEHLLDHALRKPQTGFIGVEPFVNSMAKFLANAAESNVGNVHVYDDDATQLLDWLPDNCLDGLDLLYPDPWHKKKHWKRRFVSPQNLDRFARVMKPGSVFRFASDIESYINWTLQHIHAHPAFDWVVTDANDWRTPYPHWPGTRYEAKALREGRTPCYLTIRRR